MLLKFILSKNYSSLRDRDPWAYKHFKSSNFTYVHASVTYMHSKKLQTIYVGKMEMSSRARIRRLAASSLTYVVYPPADGAHVTRCLF